MYISYCCWLGAFCTVRYGGQLAHCKVLGRTLACTCAVSVSWASVGSTYQTNSLLNLTHTDRIIGQTEQQQKDKTTDRWCANVLPMLMDMLMCCRCDEGKCSAAAVQGKEAKKLYHVGNAVKLKAI